jgi:hypothetical protein
MRERYSTRLHMTLILTATAVSGVLASRLLLRLGIGSVTLRYPINVAVAYLVFLVLVRIWIIYVRASSSGPDLPLDVEDAPDVVDIGSSFVGDGGGSGSSTMLSHSGSSPGSRSSGGGGGFSFDFDGDGALILIALGLLILVILSGGAYLIWAAPEILGEAAFNAVLASSLVNVSNRLEREGWIEGVVRPTIIPFGVVLASTMLLAYTVHHTCPPASTVREALACPTQNR